MSGFGWNDFVAPSTGPTTSRAFAEHSGEPHAQSSRARRSSFKARTLIIASLIALASAAGVFAYWTSSGFGSGSAQAGTTESVTIAADTPTTQLFPGGSSDVAAVISNPNSFTAHVPSLQLDTSQGAGGSGFDVDSGHSACGVSALSYAGSNNGGGGWVVPAKVGATDGSLAVDLIGALSMSAGAANACQGATFTVYLKVGT